MGKRLSESEVKALVDQEIRQSVAYFGGKLSQMRQKAEFYYLGEAKGDLSPPEIEGRSQVVDTTVRNTILWMLPSLIKTFCGGQNVVEFTPTQDGDEDKAKQATDYINYIFYKQNPGYQIVSSWMNDALLQKNGILKVWWDDRAIETREEYSALDEIALATLLDDSEIEPIENTSYPDEEDAKQRQEALEQLQQRCEQIMQQTGLTPEALQAFAQTMQGMQMAPAGQSQPGQTQPDMAPGMPPQGQPSPQMQAAHACMAIQQQIAQIEATPPKMLHDVTVKRVKAGGKACVENVPPEEFLISRKAKRIKDGPCGHRVRRTFSDLRSMGYKNLDNIQSDPDSQGLNAEAVERASWDDEQPYIQQEYTTPDDSQREVWLTEWYTHIDEDGDGIAEWRKIVRAGNAILEDVECDGPPFVSITPIPLPHRFFGMSIADLAMEPQRIQTSLLRAQLDNLYLQVNGRYFAVEGKVNLDDLLTSRPGGVVRVKDPAAVGRLDQAVGDAGNAMALMQYFQDFTENSTGWTRYSQGGDSDALNKMLCVETPVPMADGSVKRLAEVVDGDRIIGRVGLPVTVLAAHKIHYPVRAYDITFSSGEVITAGGEHLWSVQNDYDKALGRSRVVDTDELAKMVAKKGRVYIPRVARPQAGVETELPLDPYMLGLWLGDGSCHAPRITTMDDEIVAYMREWSEKNGGELKADKRQNSGKAASYYVGGLYAPLRALAMVRRGDEERDAYIIGKHIPEAYFRASYAQRLALLRGLMDTDGCHHSKALSIFCQNEGRLLDDVVRLIESLGGWPRVNEVKVRSAFNCTGKHFQVTFHLLDCPFAISRKRATWVPPSKSVTTQVIKAVAPVAVRPMRCLTVDAPDGLFCVGKRFTVTHNTATGINVITNRGDLRTELIARQFAETGFTDLFRMILKLVCQHQDRKAVIKLGDKWTEIDPREWTNQFDLTINVGLGTGNKDQQVQHLMMLHEMQGKGLSIGIAQPANMYESALKLTETLGFKGAEKFWTNPADPNAPKPPNPMQQEMAKLQAEQQAKAQAQQAELQAKAQIAQMEQQYKAAADAADREHEAKLEQMKAQMQAQVDMNRDRSQAEQTTLQIQQQAQLDAMKAQFQEAEAQRRDAFERWKVQFLAGVDIEKANILSKAKLQDAATVASTAVVAAGESNPSTMPSD